MRYETKLDSALSELRREAESVPCPAVRRKASWRGPAGLMAAGAVTAIALWPKAGDRAWAQAFERSDDVPRIRTVRYDGDGRIVERFWRDGRKFAFLVTGGAAWETRCDGIRRTVLPPVFGRPGLNSDRTAMLGTAPPMAPRWGAGKFSELYGNPATSRVLGKEALPDGTLRYKIRLRRPVETDHTIDVDPVTGLLRRVAYSGGVLVYEYPEKLDSALFDPLRLTTPGVRIVDLAKQRREIATVLQRGVEQNRGIRLRLVALSSIGEFSVVWTGGRGKGRVRISSPAGPSRPFDRDLLRTATRFQGKPLSGDDLTPLTKLGRRLAWIELPGPRGSIRFRNVPIVRITSPYDVGLR